MYQAVMFTYLSDINRNEKKQRSDEGSAIDDTKKKKDKRSGRRIIITRYQNEKGDQRTNTN